MPQTLHSKTQKKKEEEPPDIYNQLNQYRKNGWKIINYEGDDYLIQTPDGKRFSYQALLNNQCPVCAENPKDELPGYCKGHGKKLTRQIERAKGLAIILEDDSFRRIQRYLAGAEPGEE
ncbi:MAG: hypothetical protein Q7S56_01550 [Nanoarchaeota archaeon]|nr:hypothetical protein [Nanoarchaeota archaeon]